LLCLQSAHLLAQAKLCNLPGNTPVEEVTRALPGKDICDDALGLHATSPARHGNQLSVRSFRGHVVENVVEMQLHIHFSSLSRKTNSPLLDWYGLKILLSTTSQAAHGEHAVSLIFALRRMYWGKIDVNQMDCIGSVPVVKISELVGDLKVKGEKLILPGLDLSLDCHDGGGVVISMSHLVLELNQLGIEAVHGLDLLLLPELDLADTGGLEDTTAGLLVSVHLHHLLIDGGVDNNPGATTELTVGWEVDENRVLVGAESIDNHGAELEHLLVHVTGAARETTPVGEDDEGKVLATVEILNGSSSLVSRVGEPNLDTSKKFRFAVESLKIN
jgi:hypothetical protein